MPLIDALTGPSFTPPTGYSAITGKDVVKSISDDIRGMKVRDVVDAVSGPSFDVNSALAGSGITPAQNGSGSAFLNDLGKEVNEVLGNNNHSAYYVLDSGVPTTFDYPDAPISSAVRNISDPELRANAFLEIMSNTSHQREVKDLLAAGLNPVLSAKYAGSQSGQYSSVSDSSHGSFGYSRGNDDSFMDTISSILGVVKTVAQVYSLFKGKPATKVFNSYQYFD